MDNNILKKEMMELWEKTFHDSRDYIKLIFDNYFNEKYIAYIEKEGRIISALLGIPYQFGSGRKSLNGLYLCGLATEESFRRHGYMNTLMDQINKRVSNEFDFTFLIPSSDLLADYYRRHGYFNSFFRLEERFTSIHDFKKDFKIALLDSDERIRRLKQELFDRIKIERYDQTSGISLDQLINYLSEQEKIENEAVSLFHSKDDLRVVIKENEISRNNIFIATDKADKSVTGVAFVVKDDIDRIKIPTIYYSDKTSYFSILYHIKGYFPESSMSVYVTSVDSSYTDSMIEEVYGAENPTGESLETVFGLLERPFNPYKLMQPYGMVKLLNFQNIIEFIANIRPDADFSLYLKDFGDDGQQKIIYIVKQGRLKTVRVNEVKKEKGTLELTIKEFSEILLRKKDSNSLIMEAFGIPRLPLQMCLLLD